jgi:alanine racemase
MRADAPSTLRAVIDGEALIANVKAIQERIGDRTLMAIVKGDAYGHGIDLVVPALLTAGVRRLGVATAAEALRVHDLLTALPGGADTTLLFWIHDRTTDLTPAIARGIEVGVSTAAGFERARAAAVASGRIAHVHLKVDTGLGRGGFSPDQLTSLLTQLAAPEAVPTSADSASPVRIVGLMSHFANADVPGDPATAQQADLFTRIRAQVEDFLSGPGARFAHPDGLHTHTANSPGALGPDAVPGDLVRVGLSLYGLSPFEEITAAHLGLRPVLSLVSRVLTVKDVPAGHGASYGLTYRTEKPTRFALVAGGYADGIPRIASGSAQVAVAGHRFPVVGRIAMDQMIIDVGDARIEEGDEVVVLGDGQTGPSAEEWAAWAGTINYEIVTRVGSRVDRVLRESTAAENTAGTLTVRVKDRTAMADLAQALGAAAQPGDVLILTGNLGAGKTTFTQFLARSLDVRGRVSSPTFVLAREHPPRGTGPGLVHVDAYRLEDAAEFDDLGLDSALEESVTIIEWGRGMAESLGDHLDIEILRPDEVARSVDDPDNLDAATFCAEPDDPAEAVEDESRVVTITAHGRRWAGRLDGLTRN